VTLKLFFYWQQLVYKRFSLQVLGRCWTILTLETLDHELVAIMQEHSATLYSETHSHSL